MGYTICRSAANTVDRTTLAGEVLNPKYGR